MEDKFTLCSTLYITVDIRNQEWIIKMRNGYKARKLYIPDQHGGNELDIVVLNDILQPVTIHIYAKDEHVGTIDRSNYTVKYCIISTYHLVPYKLIPKLMTKYLVKVVVNWLNGFLLENGISQTTSPKMIVQGK